MKHEISDFCLIITLNASERAALKNTREESPEEWGTYAAENDCLDTLLVNSKLQWIDPADTGDLTDAPMLGIIAPEEENSRFPGGPFGSVFAECDELGNWYTPIIQRWAFMPYQVRSFMSDLADKGQAVFFA